MLAGGSVQVRNTYDDFGRLQAKYLHGSVGNKLAYEYNLRGWLTAINSGAFTENLYYTDGSNAMPCYNGNISSVTWQGSDGTTRGYHLNYDGLSRLTSATYGETASVSANIDRFTENITGYDKNGNILGLQRYGQTGADTYGLIDNLAYTLTGNRLNRVDDAATDSACNNGFEFKDGVKMSGEYAYDANGNLTKDLNKGITEIQSNFLNLPKLVKFSDGSAISYTYAADGTKLRTVHQVGGTATTTDYCANVIYENGTAKQLLVEGGYISLTDKKHHYYLTDHQGNNRVVINSLGKPEETNHYYPFGGVFAQTGHVQPYKYNGKEFDSKNGLNLYDYGARMYDAALGRFTTVDPLAEKYYSTGGYGYCLNNPVKFVDPDGKAVETFWDVFSLVTGVKSFSDNVKAGNVGAAIVDGVGVVLDAAATLVPLVPGGAGAAIKATRTVDNVVDASKAMQRGVKNEAKVLKDIGEVKNTKKTTVTLEGVNEKVTVIPDAVSDTKIIEVKDVKNLSNTKQIRGERQAAKNTGKKFEIVTGEKTHVSGNILLEEIVRRKDIGPQ